MTEARQITNGHTVGVSGKAVLAFAFPAVAALGTAAASWVVSGNFNTTEIRAAVGGVVLAGVGALGAWLGKTGTVKA
jgi:hypothetical protein